MRRLLALALILIGGLASAQEVRNYIVPTAPGGTNNNRAASTAFVQAAVVSGGGGLTNNSTVISGGTDGYCLYDNSGTMSEKVCGGSSSGLTINSTTITGGTTGRCLYDNSGTVGEQVCSTGSGTVTTISVATANGFAGTVANATTTPVVTIKTGVTGLLLGNGTSVAAATAGTDFLAPSGSGAALTGLLWSQIGTTPTTLSGYGITDAQSTALTAGDIRQGNGSNLAAAVTLSAAIDAAIGSTQGSVLYRSASGWFALPPGTSGQFFKTQGASANPTWGAASGGTGCNTGGSANNLLTADGSGGCITDTVTSLTNGALALGASGTAGSAAFGNATSGTITLQPVTGALGSTTLLMPAGSATLATTANINTALPSAASSQIYIGTGGAGVAAVGSTLPTGAMPALTGDVTNSSGSLATTVGKIGGHAVSLGGAFTMSGAYGFTGTLANTTAVTFPTSGTLATTANINTALPSVATTALYGGSGGAGVAQGVTVGGGLTLSGGVLSAGGGTVQVQRNTGTGSPSGVVSSTTYTYGSAPASVTITPHSTANCIDVVYQGAFGLITAGTGVAFLEISSGGGHLSQVAVDSSYTVAKQEAVPIYWEYIDAPATIGSVTYTVLVKVDSSSNSTAVNGGDAAAGWSMTATELTSCP